MVWEWVSEWVSEWDTVMWTDLPSVLSFYNLKKKESILLDEEWWEGRR